MKQNITLEYLKTSPIFYTVVFSRQWDGTEVTIYKSRIHEIETCNEKLVSFSYKLDINDLSSYLRFWEVPFDKLNQNKSVLMVEDTFSVQVYMAADAKSLLNLLCKKLQERGINKNPKFIRRLQKTIINLISVRKTVIIIDIKDAQHFKKTKYNVYCR